jgi:hypothetical protein
MSKKVPVIIVALCFLFGLPLFLGAQAADGAVRNRSVRLPWPRDDNAWSYEVVIETEIDGAYRNHLRELTQEFFIVVSLPPGRYRYHVIPYNFLGQPEMEQSSAWRSFVIPVFAPAPAADDVHSSPEEPAEPIFLPEFEEAEAPVILPEIADSAASQEPVDSTARLAPEEAIDPPKDDSLPGKAQPWAAGVSLGTAFYRPWLIATIHAAYALPHSFLEAGVDVGLVSGNTDASYYSLYPFVHYAYSALFPAKKGGFYAGAGGGYWRSSYNYSEGAATENKFIVHFITGVNIINMFDVSYTLRTDFKGISHKLSAGYVYRF